MRHRTTHRSGAARLRPLAAAALAGALISAPQVAAAQYSVGSSPMAFTTPGALTFSVQTSGYYLLTAYGAQGGNAYYVDTNTVLVNAGGLGASARGTFLLTTGVTYRALVGGKGGSAFYSVPQSGGGGGGGTFALGPGVGAANPLLVAGGGGGATGYAGGAPGRDATTPGSGAGGAGAPASGLPFNEPGSGGGGGLLGDGGNGDAGDLFGFGVPATGGGGGAAFVNGGAGGAASTCPLFCSAPYAEAGAGGIGGGGGGAVTLAFPNGGGGGGYTGGDGGNRYVGAYVAQGGTSYVADPQGTSAAGVRAGDGEFDIAFLRPATVTPEPSTWALLATGLLTLGVATRRRRTTSV